MREHAIPQDITGYRFHIIGSMTIKQFAEAGAGVLIGVLIYATNLPFFIKWPLIALAAGMGFLAAFIPIQERPLDHWLVTFVKVLYKPTKFFWKRDSKIPDPFLFTPHQENVSTETEVDYRPARRARIKEYLQSIAPTPTNNQFDVREQEQVAQIMEAFSSVTVNAVDARTLNQRPHLKVRIRSLVPQASEGVLESTTETLPPDTTYAYTLAPEPEAQTDTLIYEAPASEAVQSRLSTEMVASNLQLPEAEAISLGTNTQNQVRNTPEETATQGIGGTYVANTISTTPTIATHQAVLNTDLPFPAPPTEPNRVVGMILTPENDLINDAIVEIQTTDGRVARAVKSNALGQFFITTPLDTGDYTILIEREGYQFVPQQLAIVGQVVPPIEIRSVA